MKKRNLLTISALSFFLTQAATGCGNSPVRIAWLAADPSNTYDNANLAGATESANRLNATIQPFYAAFNPVKQLDQCNQAVASGNFDAIVILPATADGLIPCVSNAQSRKMPVVAADLPLGTDPATINPQVPGQTGAVLTPSAKFGSTLSALVVQACNGLNPCNAVYLAAAYTIIIDSIALDNLSATTQSHPNIHIVDRGETYYDKNKAYTIMKNILSNRKDINLVITSGDQMAAGAEQALKEAAPLPQAVKIIGAGAGKDGVAAVREGRFYATFVALPFDEGKLATEMAIHAFRGEPVGETGIDPVAKRGYPAFFTADNQAQFQGFEPQWQ